MRSQVRAFASRLNIPDCKLLTEQHLEFRSSKGGGKGSPESIHVKMPHCLKSHVAAHMFKRVDNTIISILLSKMIINMCVGLSMRR